MISIIAAMDEKRLIGANNDLPWHLPADLKRVKQLTTGHTIILGRKNHESIGRPLPDRQNIVLTRDTNYSAPGCDVATSIDEALRISRGEEIFVFGGANVYAQMMDLAERMYLTLIHHQFEGDTYFPAYNTDHWQELDRQEFDADEKNPFPYAFVTLQRRRSLA
jgi:dihydrofolate reductase